MRLRYRLMLILLLAAFGWLGFRAASTPAVPSDAQEAAQQAPAASAEVIKAESNLVLVDAIVTDKKGNYIRDLEAKDFHVYDDDREQQIASFSQGADAAVNAPDQKRYIVLFFDNSTMDSSDQIRARKAAAEFVEKTTSENRMMAVVDFSGISRIAQNFTADATRLKQAVEGVKFASLNPNESSQRVELAAMGAPSLNNMRSDFAARSVLLSIRALAKTLRPVAGRKSLILFSSGFALTAERESELTATIDSLNKANIAVYPVDVRGLAGLSAPGMDITNPTPQQPGFPPGALLEDSPFPHQKALLASLVAFLAPEPQRQQAPGGGRPGGGAPGGAPGGGGGVGGGRTGGSAPSPGGTTGGARPGPTSPTPTTGSRGGTATGNRGNMPGTNYNNRGFGNSLNCPPGDFTNPNCYRRQIIPPMVDSTATNQQILYALAKGTGGFTIFNTNDFAQGLLKISKELDEYYILGYVPINQAHDGSYHRIEVKVDRKGTQVRSRNGYFDTKSQDMLRGKPEGKVLEAQAASSTPGEIPVVLRAPYFYSSPGVARVNLTLSVPASTLNFEKEKGKYHGEVSILGIAYREDGSVSARFSDSVKLDYDKNDMKEFKKGAFDYQNNFDIAPGKYKLKIVLSAGGSKFGKYEMPLAIDPFTGKSLAISGPALSSQFERVSQLTAGLDAALLDERTPLVFQGTEVVPSPDCRFHKDDKAAFYVEVYEPQLETNNDVRVGVLFNIVNKMTNQQVESSNTILVNSFAQQGNPVVPVALKLPVDQLQAGDYRLEVIARDSFGKASAVKTADFTVE